MVAQAFERASAARSQARTAQSPTASAPSGSAHASRRAAKLGQLRPTSASLSRYPPCRVGPPRRSRSGTTCRAPVGAKACGPRATPPSLNRRRTLIRSRSWRSAARGSLGAVALIGEGEELRLPGRGRCMPSLRIASIGASNRLGAEHADAGSADRGAGAGAGARRAARSGRRRRARRGPRRRARASARSRGGAWSRENSPQPSHRCGDEGDEHLRPRARRDRPAVSPRASR